MPESPDATHSLPHSSLTISLVILPLTQDLPPSLTQDLALTIAHYRSPPHRPQLTISLSFARTGWGSHSDEVKNNQGGSDGSAGDPSAVPGAMPIGGELTVGGAGGGASLSPLLNYDPECARMEAWLDEHQDFVHDYFIR